MRTFIVFPHYCSVGDLEYVVIVAKDEEGVGIVRTFIVFPHYCSVGDLEYVVIVAKDEERALHLVAERDCKFKDNQYPLRVDEIEADVEDVILEQWFEEE